ncbi:hypothetical protein CRYUN_Cryun03dG0118800 [Craigia yunnanensis]
MAPASLLHLKTAAVAFASVKGAEHDNNVSRVQLPEKIRNSRVLVLGGTGRVGGSTATALSKLCPDLRIVLSGRNREKGAAMVVTLGKNSEFVEVNIDNKDSLEAALSVQKPVKTQENCSNFMNLPEVRSAHEVLEVPTVSARFGTAPFFWIWGMEAMTKLLPVEFLRDRSKVQQLVQLFDPLVRTVDGIAGERVSMRVDLECSDGRSTLALFSHRRLSVSVGNGIAAFALAIREGSTRPGVWFPEEPEGIAIEAREVLLKRASQGTINFVMNKPPWMVETDPKELGLGIYV